MTDGQKNVLAAVRSYDGEATTSEIRSETDYTNSQVHHYKQKLLEKGLVETRVEQNSGDPRVDKITVISLTEQAHEKIEKGLIYNESRRIEEQRSQREQEFYEVEQRIEDLEALLEEFRQKLNEYFVPVLLVTRQSAARNEEQIEQWLGENIDLNAPSKAKMADIRKREKKETERRLKNRPDSN
ncbi:hypothetical protein ACFO0N_08525 [Halobium salinum]|uniref:MarR family transcriptional regulator n=1 Tax=Halobium salinum TaxID=1364940 RepID=A0ABD5PAP0_9EURY|nr:hypothetical protein [Halobium salinum]